MSEMEQSVPYKSTGFEGLRILMKTEVELELSDDLGDLVDDFEDEFGKLRIAEKASGSGE